MKTKLINNFIKFDKNIISNEDKNIVELWFCIRYAVYYNSLTNNYFKLKPKNYLKLISKFFFQVLQTLKIVFFIFNRKKILEIDVVRHKIYGKKKNSTISHILQKNNFNFATISLSSSSKIFDKKINVVLLVHLVHIFLKIYTRFNKSYLPHLSLVEKKFNYFFRDKIKIDFQNIYKSIYLQQVAILFVIKLFIKLFGSKKIIYIENPSLFKLIQFCGKNSIETFDVQHSMVSNLNILNKFYINKKYDYLITKKIIIWGNYWKKFYSYNHRCISIGYLENSTNFQTIKKKKQIFIVSSIFSRKYLIELLKFLSTNLKDYKIIYKLRLEENFTEIKNFINFDKKNVLFLKTLPENQLKKIISQSLYVIGTNSTLLSESMGISNVIVYKKGWYNEYNDLIKKNIFFLGKNCKHILSIIKNKKNIKKKLNPNKFFQKPKIFILRNLLR